MAMRIEDWREISGHYTDGMDDEPEPTDAELAAIDAEARAVDVMAWNEREWFAAQAIRFALADLALATIESHGEPL
jgi:hypothetical protein